MQVVSIAINLALPLVFLMISIMFFLLVSCRSVIAGGGTVVKLLCYMLACGLRLDFDIPAVCLPAVCCSLRGPHARMSAR
jgi:hypothetical protein